jgi:hypothetical protein
MASLRISIAAAFALGVIGLSIPASAAETGAGKVECNHTVAQYNEAIRQLHILAEQARAMAEQNPLYESDVKYYASVLLDAYECSKTMAPLTTAAAAR